MAGKRTLEASFQATVEAAELATGVPEPRVVHRPLPKLYVYDHCPYCVIPRMLLGLKKIKHELVFVANDDFETPMRLIGKKAVPILEYRSAKTIAAAKEKKLQTCDGEECLGIAGFRQDGTLVMPESLDIVKQLDEDETLGAGPPMLSCYTPGAFDDIREWNTCFSSSLRRLLYPRYAQSACLPEFASKRSRDMFTARHPLAEPSDYSENFRMSGDLIPEANKVLATLAESVLQSPYAIRASGSPTPAQPKATIDDFAVWARLRCATVVKGLEWPETVVRYLNYYSECADIPLLTQLAL